MTPGAVCVDRLREMPADDMSLPSQAMQCRLACIRVATEAGVSQTDVIQSMWKLFAGRALLAIVRVRTHGGS